MLFLSLNFQRERVSGKFAFKKKLFLSNAAGGEHDPSLATLLNNRAACFLKTGECNNCIRDCTHSLSLQPLNNVKALLRRGSAYEMKEK